MLRSAARVATAQPRTAGRATAHATGVDDASSARRRIPQPLRIRSREVHVETCARVTVHLTARVVVANHTLPRTLLARSRRLFRRRSGEPLLQPIAFLQHANVFPIASVRARSIAGGGDAHGFVANGMGCCHAQLLLRLTERPVVSLIPKRSTLIVPRVRAKQGRVIDAWSL